MRDPVEIEITELTDLPEQAAVMTDIIEAVRRAHHDERTTWLTLDGLRCAAIVPLEVGRVMDTDELPKPGTLPAQIHIPGIRPGSKAENDAMITAPDSVDLEPGTRYEP